MNIGEAFKKFILNLKRRCLSDKTIYSYKCFVTPFIDYVGNDMPLSSLSIDDFELYLDYILLRPLSKATVATYVRHIKAFLHYCEPLGLSFNACEIHVPKSPKRNVRIYTSEEMGMIFDSVNASIPWIAERNKAMIALMYDSGLRQCELCNLKRSWIPSDARTIKVRGKGDKERTVPLGVTSAKLMNKYISDCPFESEFLFVTVDGSPMTTNAVRLMMYKLCNKLPFEFSSHRLRHNFATNWCIDQYMKYGNIDIFRLQIIMGHDDQSTTKRYLHLAMEYIASLSNISHLDNIACNIK